MELRRVLPDRASTTTAEAVAGLDLGDLAPAERPYVVANMVASADGKASFQGRSGKLGTEVDREVFHRLRTQADAVLVGSGTIRAERYGRLVRDPELRAAREREGLRPDPLACLVSRSLDLPVDAGIFQDPEQRTVIFTSSERSLEGTGPGTWVERLPAGELTLLGALQRLRSAHDVRSVLCEGGPNVLGGLLAEGAVDELFLTVAPRLAGGAEAPSIVEGPPQADLVEMDLVWVLEAEGELFVRYRIWNSQPGGTPFA
jgi:riboflavin-specific deaminase-like protein